MPSPGTSATVRDFRHGGEVPAVGVGPNPCDILCARSAGAVWSDVFFRVPGGTMPEILTESFCERCGTRYTFESAAPAKTKRGIGRFKTTAKGLKNYVMSDDTSLDEAMAAARSDDEREQTTQQLDAFHATFNFCMTCRQYTCGNCWNEAEGRCLTCAPHLGHEILPAPFPELPVASAPVLEAWPQADLNPGVVDGFPAAVNEIGRASCRERGG